MHPAPTTSAVAVLIAVAVVTVSNRQWWLYPGGLLAVAAVATLAVGHLVASPTGTVSRWLSTRVPVWLGKRSYAFYLWHGPVILLLRPHVHSVLLLASVALIASLVVTQASWTLVEQPALRLKHRFEQPAGLTAT